MYTVGNNLIWMLYDRGSQEERIGILRMALSQKGIPQEAHCANGSRPLPPPSQDSTAHVEPVHIEPIPPVINGHASADPHTHIATEMHTNDSHDGGIDL